MDRKQMELQKIHARVVPGHQVASGRNGDPRFPGGTVRMQLPHFQQRGLDLRHLYPGTVNVSIAPLQFRVRQPRYTFPQVQWHPTAPAETFSFFDVGVRGPGGRVVAGFIYYPHPETKPEHFQQPDVLELLLPFMDAITYGADLILEISPAQILIETPVNPAGQAR